MAGPDAGIEAVAHDIDKRAVGDDFQSDGRVSREKFGEDRLYYLLRRGARHREAQVPSRLVTEDVDRIDRRLEALECRSQLRQEALAHLRRSDAARGPVEQADAELFLERPNGFAQCRARDAELTRRLGEARALGNRHEGVHLGKPQLSHWSDTPNRPCGSCPIAELLIRPYFCRVKRVRRRPRQLQRSSRRSGPHFLKENDMEQVSRYHPLLVAMHWVLALLIIAALGLGALVMAKVPNTDPMKLEALRSHMSGGVLILILMLVRLFFRTRTRHPAPATAGAPFLGRTRCAPQR